MDGVRIAQELVDVVSTNGRAIRIAQELVDVVSTNGRAILPDSVGVWWSAEASTSAQGC